MRTSKNTRLGIIAGTGAAALAVAGFALPAHAADQDSSVQESTTTTTAAITSSFEALQAWVTDTARVTDALNTNGSGNTVAPNTGIGDVSVVEGPLVGGDVLSGNQAPVGSGNDVAAPVGSGNDVTAPVEAPIGSGNDTGVSTGDVSGSVDGLVGDVSGSIGDVTGSVGDISGEVGGIVDNATGDLDLGLGDILN
ncbi:hypothetical protein ACIQLJ_13410 [Microbacterium sp. NPDC091313]